MTEEKAQLIYLLMLYQIIAEMKLEEQLIQEVPRQ